MEDLHITDNPVQSIQVYRPHILDLLMPTLWSLLMLLPILLIILAVNAVGLTDQPLLKAGEWLFGGLYLVFVGSYFMMNVNFWYMDAWIIMPTGLMDVQLTSLFNRRVAQLGWNQVQDVQVLTTGVLATLFGYGNIRIQSAGKEGIFTMRAISNPRAVANLIDELRANSQQTAQDSPPTNTDLPTNPTPPQPFSSNLSNFSDGG